MSHSRSLGPAPPAYAPAVPPTGRRGISAKLSAAAAIVTISAASVAVRWPGLTQGRFASHDVGGILYNAMLLRSGGLPYVDSIELKAPGTFYLATLLAGPEARDIAAFQVAANSVAVASLLLLAALAWRLWGPVAAVVAAALYALHDAHLDSMDANYVTWAQLPQVAAGLLAACAAVWREGHGRKTLSPIAWLLAGAACGLAALCKQPSGFILVPVLAWAAFPPGRRDLSAGSAVLAGAALAHLPVALHYLARGHLAELATGYLWNPWGYEYITGRAGLPWTRALWEWLAATTHFVALPLALAAFALAARPRPPAPTGSPPPADPPVPTDILPVPGATRALVVWALAALAAAAVGLRFYKGYYLAVLPPLCLLAAAPWGALSPAVWRRGKVRLLLAPLLAILALRAGFALHATRVDRARPHDDATRTIGRFLARNTAPNDRIWVWGWHLWGTYAYSGRLSASRVYKTLGLLTPVNTDTWRTPAPAPTFLTGSPYAQLLLDDLSASPPAFIVLGGTAPRDQFIALRRFLAAEYVRDLRLRIGRVEVWRRRDLPGA